ncbi:MAG TPA: hypothetical protein VLF14_00220 [Candidatus Binatia bacterium]|nr:hypothetical protein [Candidatus Binatia bacterium]
MFEPIEAIELAIIARMPGEAFETWSFRLWGFSAPQTVTVGRAIESALDVKR